MATNQTLRTHCSIGSDGSVTSKASAYTELGYVDDDGLKITPQLKEREVWGPKPGGGRLVRLDITETGRAFDVTVTIIQNTFLLWELIFGTPPISGAGGYTPNGATTVTKKAWVKLQQYDEQDQIVNTVEFWARLKITGTPTFGGEGVRYDLEAMQIYSTVQTGTLANMT